MKKVSILIPAYNEGKYIEACLESVCKINYPNYEIIVCDNNSTDNTALIVQKYKKVILINEKKKGTNAARQKAFSVSTGDIIVTLDADSVPESNWLHLALKHFENPNIVAVSGICKFDGNYWYTSILFWIQKSFIFKSIHFFIHKVIGKYALIFGSNAWYRRESLLQIGGFNCDITFWGDDAYTGEMITKVGKVIYDPKIIVTTSSRRYAQTGPLSTMSQYVKNYISMWIFKKPITKEKNTATIR